MKKVISALYGALIYLSFAPLALAGPKPPDSGTTGNSLCPPYPFDKLCGLQTSDIGPTIGKFIAFIFVIAVIAALFYLIWGGLKWLTSAGDKTALQAAREHIVAAIVGLIIIFLSYFLLSFIVGFFVPNFNIQSLTIPSL